MSTTFEYLGYEFTPLGTVSPKDFKSLVLDFRSIGISKYHGGQWDYQEFYRLAKTADCGEVDVFSLDGKRIVVPCRSELFAYDGAYFKFPQSSKAFLVTVHLVIEAQCQAEAVYAVSNCLNDTLQGQSLIADWMYTKNSDGLYESAEEIKGLDLKDDYAPGAAFTNLYCDIRRVG